VVKLVSKLISHTLEVVIPGILYQNKSFVFILKSLFATPAGSCSIIKRLDPVTMLPFVSKTWFITGTPFNVNGLPELSSKFKVDTITVATALLSEKEPPVSDIWETPA